MDRRAQLPARVWLACMFAAIPAAAVVGCTLAVPSPPIPAGEFPPGVEVTIAPSQMRLELSNGTTIAVDLAVNGQIVSRVPAGASADLGVDDVGPLPWDTIVTTTAGRPLLGLVVHAGDASIGVTGNGGRSQSGVGVRVDLSCGRIDLWSGPPMLGPPPGPGSPGDCDP